MPKSSKIFILITLLITVSGCFKANKQTDKGSGASFVVGEVTGRSDVLPDDMDPSLNYPKRRTYTFTACVKNWVTDAKLYGQKFVVSDGRNEFPATLTDDDKGCFTWQEKVSYNFLASKSVYVEHNRTIKGATINRGEVQIPLVLMPWVQDRKLSDLEIRDLRYKPLPTGAPLVKGKAETLKALNGDDRGMRGFVWIDRINTENIGSVDQKGGGFVANITMEPKIRYRDAQGAIRHIVMTDGKFRVEPIYISAQTVNGKVDRKFIAKPVERMQDLKPSIMRDGVLRARVHMNVPQQCTFGELELALRIVPVGMPEEIDAFEGVFLVGDCDRLMNSAIGRVREFVFETKDGKERTDFDLTKWNAENVKELDVKEANDGFKTVNQFDFSSATLRFLGVEDETVTERTIQFRTTTCVTDPITRKPIEGLNFKISRVEDDGTLTALTQERDPKDLTPGGDRTQKREACLTWADTLRHKYYIPERYFQRTVEIEHIRSGNKHRVTLAINPWDYGFTFGHDVSDLGEKYFAQMNSKPRPKSYMILYNFRYETIRFRYEIDQFMTLKVKKTVLLRIDPRVIRYSSIPMGQERNEPIRDGYYLMKTAFQKHYLDQEGNKAEYIDAFKTLVLVRSGVIVTPIDLEVSDLRLMRLRSNFLIELEPIDERRLGISASHTEKFEQLINDKTDFDNYTLNPEESGLAPRTFVGPIIALSNYFGAGMRPTDELQEVLCKTVNCNQESADETLAEHEKDRDLAKFYGKLSHLENVSVTELIRKKKEEIKPNYLKRMKELSSYGNFLTSLNLEYLQLANPELMEDRFKRGELEKINKVIPYKNMPKYFLDELNEPEIWSTNSGAVVKNMTYSHPPAGLYQKIKTVSLEDLSYLINENKMVKISENKQNIPGRQWDKSLRTRLCNYWFNNFLPKTVGLTRDQLFGKKWGYLTDNTDDIVSRCVVDGGLNPANEVFDFTQMIRVNKVPDYDFKRGLSFNMQVGADFKINHNQDYKSSSSIGFKPFNTISNIFRDIVGVDFNIQWSKGESNARSEGRNFNNGTNLVVQVAKFNIKVSEYERCSYLKIKPSFLNKIDFLQRIASSGSQLTYRDAIGLATRGLLICSGQPIDKDPVVVRENYYYFTQMFNDGDMLDLGDQKNHPWLLALRGKSDYTRFVRLMKEMNIMDKIENGKNLFGEGDQRALDEANAFAGGWQTGFLSSDKRESVLRDEAKVKQEDLWRHYGSVLGFDPVKHLQWKTKQPNKKEVDEVLDAKKERLFQGWEYREHAGMSSKQFFPLESSPIEWESNRLSIADMYIKKGYEMGDFPINYTADMYQSTLPTFPGFIVITEDSSRTKEAY